MDLEDAYAALLPHWGAREKPKGPRREDQRLAGTVLEREAPEQNGPSNLGDQRKREQQAVEIVVGLAVVVAAAVEGAVQAAAVPRWLRVALWEARSSMKKTA